MENHFWEISSSRNQFRDDSACWQQAVAKINGGGLLPIDRQKMTQKQLDKGKSPEKSSPTMPPINFLESNSKTFLPREPLRMEEIQYN